MISVEMTTLGKVVARTGGTLQTGPFGSQLHASDYSVIGTPLIMPVNLGNNEINEAGIARVGNEHVRRLRRHALRDGDIIFSRRGDVGRRSIVRREQAGWLCGTGCLAARFGRRLNDINPAYIALYIGTIEAQTWLQDNAVGGTMPNLNTSILAALPIRLPERREQDRAVDAINSAEAMVTALERHIAKKQAIKQGMMQQLLTGRTRLPGFMQEWVDLQAGDLGTFKGGSGFAPRYQGAVSGPLPFFKVSDMNNNGNELFMRRANNYVTEVQRKSMGAVLMPADTIVFAKVGAAVFLERKRILTVPSCIDNNMAAYSVDKGRVDVRFMHYVLQQFPMGSLVATGALPSLNGSQLRSIPISLPLDLAEQRAIAGVLADADAELDVLAAHLEKAHAIKTGTMQQLLTGRTRLPVEAVS